MIKVWLLNLCSPGHQLVGLLVRGLSSTKQFQDLKDQLGMIDICLFVWIGGEFDKITVWVSMIMTIQLPNQTYTYASTREGVGVKSY